MGKSDFYGNQLRERLKAERERRDWSQKTVSTEVRLRGVPGFYHSTLAKIEAGSRSVRVDELAALADIFGTSTDALIGRKSSGGDLMWAVSKLTSAAHKAIDDVNSVVNRIAGEMEDVQHYAQFDSHSVDPLTELSEQVCIRLKAARALLQELAGQFPGSKSGD